MSLMLGMYAPLFKQQKHTKQTPCLTRGKSETPLYAATLNSNVIVTVLSYLPVCCWLNRPTGGAPVAAAGVLKGAFL